MVKTVKLKDRRTLAYEEYGDLKGKPVFYFHGWPASRLSGRFSDTYGMKLKLRIISPDRPGFGLSTFKPCRKLLDWPCDVCELADKLGFNKFSVFGASGGGPYVSACAYKIPNRLISAGIVAGLGPLIIKNSQGLTKKQQIALKAVSFLGKKSYPVLIYYKFILNHFPEFFRRTSLIGKAVPDKKIAAQEIYKQYEMASFQESFRQGTKGPLEELKIYCSDWKFDLTEIKMKVFLWHGILDKNVPIWLGKYVASQIPNCKASFWEENGHFLIASRGEEILSKL